MRGSQVTLLWRLTLTANWGTKEKRPNFIMKKTFWYREESVFHINTYNTTLEKINLDTATNSKHQRVILRVQRLSTTSFPRKSVSSPYCRWDTTNLEFHTLKHENILNSLERLNEPLRPSTTMMNRKWARRSPYVRSLAYWSPEPSIYKAKQRDFEE